MAIEEERTSIQEVVEARLEETECPHCHFCGMLLNGGYNYICPNCGYEGFFDNWLSR